jgi:hypothetical protein
VVRGFRRMVQQELDRVLVQSTVSAPRFAVGMLASEELARLDLAAEDLLESVATGRTKLKLDPKTASVAASLATAFISSRVVARPGFITRCRSLRCSVKP